MKKFYKQIVEQINFSSAKNVFCDQENSSLCFAPPTLKFIETHRETIRRLNEYELTRLSEFSIQCTTEKLYQINQYYHFTKEDLLKLNSIYLKLFHWIKNGLSLQSIEKNHYSNLKNWLEEANPFAEKIYSRHKPYIDQTVICSEYSPEIQLNILGIDLHDLEEPILDIGCGQNALLVRWLRKKGFEAYGIDRMAASAEHIMKADWFDFQFLNAQWGTIISNLGFSNQFKHHHLRQDGMYIEYARKYMEILNSLKRGGKFYYAPDLPFVEPYLDRNKFEIRKKRIHQIGCESTMIQNLDF